MRPGEVVAGRFEIERLAGTGAMGAVYRARDRQGGGAVALKLLHPDADDQLQRFSREAEILSQLRHPGIVRYVAHGLTPPFLAMEWLEGSTLADRLELGPLPLDEALTLVRATAVALAAAHRHGVVHRDLKPSNLLLPGGDAAAVKILDFGVARLWLPTLTGEGVAVGTPGFMAPEQARGTAVDERADVFALGCVLFRCLAGQPPFPGDDAMAVLLRVVLQDAPRLRSIDPSVPEAVDELCARMIAKSPDERPRDGDAVVQAVAELGPSSPSRVGGLAAALTRIERRALSLVLGHTVRLHSEAATLSRTDERFDALRAAVRGCGESLDVLADGALLVTVASGGSATDRAAVAARCALAIRGVIQEAPLAVVSGRGVVSGEAPVGELIDRGVELLEHAVDEGIRLDEVTAGLLDARFDVAGDAEGLVLGGERAWAEAPRTLLGKPTPCVGRERELTTLGDLFDECVSEPIARAVMVTGVPGIGKSRLRAELLQRIRTSRPEVEIWSARGDRLRAGSAFGLLAAMLGAAAGLADGEPRGARRKRIRARVARHLDPGEVDRVAEFLGELLGADFPDERRVQLRAARRDPALMGDQIRRAWGDLVAAECGARPLVLVLEDLQWGDSPTVQLVDATLQQLAGQPLMVIAMARPELRQVFPRLWVERDPMEIHLGGLTRKGGERLVREVLGDSVPAERVSTMVEHAGGNAFYLEELIRAFAEDHEELPETVLAMAHARLERLDDDARRVLRAASVFGEVFRHQGVAALLADLPSARLREALQVLTAQEAITRRAERRGSVPDEEYVFRHALVREAAYGMLTDTDRVLGHRLAGEWLEADGDADPMVLAEHFERGERPDRAVAWYRRAAERALEGNDLDATIERAARAIASGADGAVLGACKLLQAEALRWRGDRGEALRCALEARESLPPGSAGWYAALSEIASASGALGLLDRLIALADELTATPAGPHTLVARALAMARLAGQLFMSGIVDRAGLLVARIDEETAALPDEPGVAAAVHRARALRAGFTGEPALALTESKAWAAALERTGDLRWLCRARVSVGYASSSLGQHEEAERLLVEAVAMSERIGLASTASHARHDLGMVLARMGRLAEAEQTESRAAEAYRAAGDVRMEGLCRVYLSMIQSAAGDAEGAERSARAALDLLGGAPLYLPQAHAALADARLARGDAEGALASAVESMRRLEALGRLEEGEYHCRLAHVRALYAIGDEGAAASALRIAHTGLLAQAARIDDSALRRSFLERVPEHAATLELARAEGLETSG